MAYDDPARLYFFFDYISHNAYLAWHKAPALARKYGLTLTPVPVLFGAMLSHYKQVGPAEVPAKSRWMLWNVLRKARLHDIPIAPPASHPFNPLVPLRVTCTDMTEAQRVALTERLFRAVWAESRPIAEAPVVGAILSELGLPAERMLAEAQSDPIKQRLRENTEQALGLGVFGVPTLLVRGPGSSQAGKVPGEAELFWGFDDLSFLEMFLSGRDPLPADRREFQPWQQVRPSVERRR